MSKRKVSELPKLPARIVRILLSLRQGFIDETPEYPVHNSNEELIKRSRLLLAQFPLMMRWGFFIGLYTFDRVTFLFGFGLRRFVNMKLPNKQKYVQRWMHSDIYAFRSLAVGFRGFVMVNYFSHKDTWKHIGYEPHAHVKEKLELREKLMTAGAYSDAAIGSAVMDKGNHDS